MTIRDIAKECNCAVGTVSRVLNNHPDVSDRMRKKVQGVVDKYGFVLNANARLLKAQDHRSIAVLVKGTSSILLNSLLEKVQKKIEVLGYNVNVIVLDEYDNEALRADRVYYELKPVGMILLGGSPDKYPEDFAKIRIPCVLISNQASDSSGENISSVSTDNFQAALFAAQFLIRNGHKKIGVIGGELETAGISKSRYDGFLAAVKDAGLSFDFEKSYVVSKYSFEGGFDACGELLEKNPDLTAIYTMSDVMAIGACRKLFSLGKRIPDDVSVTGFDGLPVSDYYCPRITTIRQIQDSLVDSGIDCLINSIEKGFPHVHRLIPFEFIEGESVKKI